jgi:acyl-coenzyme A thioesterase PaaI-like protein
MRDGSKERFGELDMPLTRLLAINLGIGVALALLLVGGLLVLNPGGLRDLILADRSPTVAIALLLGGFIITFASTAMGTAIMAMGVGEQDDEPRDGWRVVKQRAEKQRADMRH